MCRIDCIREIGWDVLQHSRRERLVARTQLGAMKLRNGQILRFEIQVAQFADWIK